MPDLQEEASDLGWYWAISCSNTIRRPMVIDDAILPVSPELLDDGKVVEGWDGDAVMRVREERWSGEPDDVLQNYLGLPIYSTRLKLALELHGITGFQYLPTRVFGFDSVELPTFYIANVVELRPALDPDLSEYDVFPPDYFLPARRGKLSGLRSATLLESQLLNCDALRLTQYPASIYVSQRFRSVFEKLGCTGYSFEPVTIRQGA